MKLFAGILILTSAAWAQKPLTIASQGSFFVGGETKSLPPAGGRGGFGAGDITINQMYVQYQIPMNGAQHVPVVMVHGCCLSSKTWETTPDGRMGWSEYFVRKDRSVYLADQSSRARSGFDPSTIVAVKAGTMPPSQLPNILTASHQTAWTVFRFGPKYGEAFPDGQFPIQAVDELYKQMIPDLNSTLPNPNPTLKNMAALAVKLKGAVLIGHSESGFFPEQAALTDPSGIKGLISIEMGCPDLKPEEIAIIAKIPTMVMFGDHLNDVQGGPANWASSLESCNKFVQKVKDKGGDAEMMYLPKMGIKGNSHMLMQDKNNLQLADLILTWIDGHVESQKEAKKGSKEEGSLMSDWPPLPFAEWEQTCDTLHMWTQIVGKTRMALTPLENHWWNVPLYVTPRGLSTSAIPWKNGSFSMEFDLVAHQLLFHSSVGVEHCMRLFPRSVADFYAEYMTSLKSLGIEVKIYKVPVEFDDLTPFDQDTHHASYDTEYVERFRRILVNCDRVFKQFRSRFLGKCSPVHFFWGSFDLAVTRFSGRRAPEREGVDPVTREAYSHEVTSCGFWPGDRRFPHPAFYAYSAPVPPGLDKEPIRPAGTASWNTQLGEFIFKYEDARGTLKNDTSPDQSIIDFCQSAYEAGAKLAQWDRTSLER